jgi:hypothetical protein
VNLPDGDVIGGNRQPAELEKIPAGLRHLSDLPPCNLSCANLDHGDELREGRLVRPVVPISRKVRLASIIT